MTTQETKQKISDSMKGRKHSEETRQKIADSIRGRKHSEETRQKISTAMQGKQPSEETRQKMMSSQQNRQSAARRKQTHRAMAIQRKRDINPLIEYKCRLGWLEEDYPRWERWGRKYNNSIQKCFPQVEYNHNAYLQLLPFITWSPIDLATNWDQIDLTAERNALEAEQKHAKRMYEEYGTYVLPISFFYPSVNVEHGIFEPDEDPHDAIRQYPDIKEFEKHWFNLDPFFKHPKKPISRVCFWLFEKNEKIKWARFENIFKTNPELEAELRKCQLTRPQTDLNYR